MTIFAIADLHLDTGDKPMDVFGVAWAGHQEHIFLNWSERVSREDLVLVPGDISWAMQLDGAREHLRLIGGLPGRKIILRGNHDYWWNSVSRVRDALPRDMFALQNDSFLMDGVLIAGSRGWLLPGSDGFTQDDQKVYDRELIRLEMSLKSARAKDESAPLVCMTHFPPRTQEQEDTGFTRLMKQYGVRHAVYGHLHGPALKNAVRGEHGGIVYHQVSADGIGFGPVEVCGGTA